MLTHEFSSISISDNSAKKMDSNRNHLRRLVSHKDTEFSSQSIMRAIETFNEAVQEMDATILVPSRLMDLEVGDSSDTVGLARSEHPIGKTDLHTLYNLVNWVSNDLLWSSSELRPEDESSTATNGSRVSQDGSRAGAPTKGHFRRPSTASMASTNSFVSTVSDTDSEAGMENDSGVEGEVEKSRSSTEKVRNSFRRHLYGLQRSLEQMTEAAGYLTKRYQNEVGSTV